MLKSLYADRKVEGVYWDYFVLDPEDGNTDFRGLELDSLTDVAEDIRKHENGHQYQAVLFIVYEGGVIEGLSDVILIRNETDILVR